MYTEKRPALALQPWVNAIWATSGNGAMHILPDGCADVIFDLDSDTVSVVGTMTRSIVVDASHDYLGIRFRPGRLANLLGVPLDEVTDRRVTLRDLNRRIDLRPTTVEHDLARLVGDVDRRVDAAIHIISRTAGTCDIERVARSVNVTRQHLARLFAHHVGVSPKMFARVMRFRRAMRLGATKPWADVAADLGYSDQSHLIADFREFSGSSPVPFFLSSTGDAA